MKILYVEDNAVNLSLIQRIAQMNQHELISFDEAELALDALANGEEVDLILLDIQLAGEMDGIDFAKALRARGDTSPIIAITAYAMMGDKERILEAGCNEYLPKPLPIAEFLTLLAKYDPGVREAEAPSEAKEAATPAQDKPASDQAEKSPAPGATPADQPDASAPATPASSESRQTTVPPGSQAAPSATDTPPDSSRSHPSGSDTAQSEQAPAEENVISQENSQKEN